MPALNGGRPSRSVHRIAVAAIALAAAAPSVLWGLLGGGFLSDDWAVWLVFDERGVVGGLRQLAFEQPARPLAAPYYALIYLVIGDAPVLQGLLIGAINAGVILAAWFFGRQVLPPRIVIPALAVFALLPNRAATRLWFVVGTYSLALTLAFVALGLLVRRRAVASAGAMVAATLVYEGVVVLALAIAALWTLRELRSRLPAGLVFAIPTIAVAFGSFLASPKRGGRGPGPMDNVESFIPGQFGTGLWGSPLLAQLAGAVVLLAVAAAVAGLLPSFRGRVPESNVLLLGAALTIAGAVPFFVSGSIFGTSGVFDRNNLVPGVGVALILVACWVVVRDRSALGGRVLTLAALAWFAVLQVEDLRNWEAAVDRGDALVAALASAPAVDHRGTILIVPQQKGDAGVADFIYNGDLEGAMRYRHGGEWSGVRLIENVRDCEAWLDASSGAVQVFDWETERLDVLTAPATMSACAAWQS